MKTRFFLLPTLLLLSLLLPGHSGAPAVSTSAPAVAIETAAIDQFINAQMDKHRLPGVALAVIQEDQIIYTQGYGRADGERPLTADTPMYIGSIAKSFTALAVMQLVEAGQIDLDAPVQTYLPWFTIADETAATDLTVRHFLHHTSGLSEMDYISKLPDDAAIEESVRNLRQANLTAEPGTLAQYFNPNYQVLGLIVETVSGQPYGAYLEEHVFTPLAMTNTTTSPQVATQNGLAQGHTRLFGFPVPMDQPYRAYGLPSGYIISTAEDMAHYAIAMNNFGRYGETAVLSGAGVRALHTPGIRNGFTYGMGWGIGDYYGSRRVEHGGTNEAYYADLILLPEQRVGVVLLVNEGHLLDAFTSRIQLREGVLALAAERPLPEIVDGASVRLIGWVLLILFLLTLAFSLRNLLQLRGWKERVQSMTGGKRLWDVASHFLIPVVIVVGVSTAVTQFMQRAFTWERAFLQVPDLMLWLLVGIVPDLFQGVVKTIWILRREA